MKLSTNVLLLFGILTQTYIVFSQSLLAVHETCTTTINTCPRDSTCRPTSCDGFTCLCNNGFVASEDRSTCVKAVRIGEQCETNLTRCISEYAKCIAGTCSCVTGFVPTKDGRCKIPGTNFVGENCGMCEFPAKCIDGTCKCVGQFRSLTTDEFWVDPLSTLQCRPNDYDLDKCNGTFIDPSLKPDVPPTSLPTKSVPGLISSNDWSLIMPEKSIHDSCSLHSQCPENARCRPNSCDGFLCLCNIGYIASDDRLQCVPAVKTGDVCNPRIDQCLSPFATCSTGICKCSQFSSSTIDGRCRVSRRHFIGENCRSNEECEYPGTCQNGYCACVDPNRPLTNEEFWIDPTLDIQCRPKDYSVWKCNGSIIAVPTQFHNDIPIDIEIELTCHATHSKDRNGNKDTKEHAVKEGEEHIEINPAIIVDDHKEDDDSVVPLHIIGFLAAAVFALLIAFIFKTKRRRAIKRDVSTTRTNIMANKDLMSDEDMSNSVMQSRGDLTMTSKPIAMATQMQAPAAHFQRSANMSIYNKNGWHHAELLNDSTTDIYPDSNTTTRSTGPFIIESQKNGGGGVSNGDIPKGIIAPFDSLGRPRAQLLVDGGRNGPYIVDGQRNGHVAGTLPDGPYLIEGQRNGHTGTLPDGPYIIDAQRQGHTGTLPPDGYRPALYANEAWHHDSQSNDDDLVMF